MKNLFFIFLLIPLLVGCGTRPDSSEIIFKTSHYPKYMDKVCIEGVRYYYDGQVLAPALEKQFGEVRPVICNGSEKK